MIEITLPGRNLTMTLQHLVLDVNGTLTVDGQLIPGVKERIALLKQKLSIYLLTADTLGRAAETAAELGIELFRVDPIHGGLDKKAFVNDMGQAHTAAIGNGYNDVYMLQEAALGIAVLGREGCSAEATRSAEIIVNDINDALDLLLIPGRLVATLRG